MAYARRLGSVLDELEWWKQDYRRRAAETSIDLVRSRFLERAEDLDTVWHELHAAWSDVFAVR